MKRQLLTTLLIVSVMSLGTAAAGGVHVAKAAPAPKATVYQSTSYEKGLDYFGVKGSGFEPNAYVTVGLTGSYGTTVQALANKSGRWDTGLILAVDCPTDGSIVVSATADDGTNHATAHEVTARC